MKYNLINNKISFLQEKLIEAKQYYKEYLKTNSKKDLLAIERLIEQIVETSIKVNKEILKEKNILILSYKESFLKLDNLNIFNKLFLEKIAETATFRNELAHEYINMSSTYSIKNIEKILDIYPEYLLKIINYINLKEEK